MHARAPDQTRLAIGSQPQPSRHRPRRTPPLTRAWFGGVVHQAGQYGNMYAIIARRRPPGQLSARPSHRVRLSIAICRPSTIWPLGPAVRSPPTTIGLRPVAPRLDLPQVRRQAAPSRRRKPRDKADRTADRHRPTGRPTTSVISHNRSARQVGAVNLFEGMLR